MNKQLKHLISVILVFLMFLAFLPTGVMAAGDEANISLEQAIQTVKQHFTIPGKYTVFSSSYRSSETQQIWSLRWSAPEDQSGRFNAEVDAQTGIILSMNIWKDSQSKTDIPTISIEQAQNIGNQLLKEILPKRSAYLQAIPSNQVIPLNSWGGGEYSLNWQRRAYGIRVENEGARMDIDYTSGQVTSYRLNWSDYEIPDPQKAISIAEARNSFESNEMLELQYLLNEIAISNGSDEETPVKLVYRIHHPSNAVIDAFTGEPMEQQEIRNFDTSMIVCGKGAQDESIKEKSLSPQEQKEVERYLSLLSQEEAVAAVEEWFSVPSELELTEVNLNQDYLNPDLCIWNLSWHSTSEDTDSPSYMNARVNAASGELISFYQNSPNSDATAVLPRDKAHKIANSFLKKIQPERSQELRLADENFNIPQPVLLENASIPDEWFFHYERMVDGIPCPADSIAIEVDSRTKMINSYYMNWTDISFPPAQSVMGIQKACDTFLSTQPLTLQYVKNYAEPQTYGEGDWQYRLIYRPQHEATELQSDMIDAVNGENLSWDGTPLTRDPQPCIFTDISGHFAEKEISLLGQAGIMCEYETAFHPQEEIELVTFLRAMLVSKNSYYRADNISDEDIIKQAKENKWLSEDIQADTIVTRDLLAKLMVRMLNIEYIAQMPSPALQAPYKDYASLSSDLKGYAALTWGLDLIKGDNHNFNAAHKITRGEAAAVLVRTLQTGN